MTRHATQFTHAIVRAPGHSCVRGLRAVDSGEPDLPAMLAAHADYVAALRAAGARVVELPALEAYPDSVFVEDTALCLPQGAILLRPGAASRRGEVAEMAAVLREQFPLVRAIEGPGFIDGGDILVTAGEILIGRSARTDPAGIAELSRLVMPWGYPVREVATPEGVLHLKTDCALLDEETVLATSRLAATGCFADYRVITLPAGEEAAANTIRFNDSVIMAVGYPRTADTLRAAGFRIREVDNREFAKLDGGMSCLSLRFQAA